MRNVLLLGVLGFSVVGLLGCGGGSGGGSGASSNNNNGQGGQSASVVASYEFPEFYQENNYLLMGDHLVLFGGQTGTPDLTKEPFWYCGHSVYSKKIYVINLASGQQQEYAIESPSCKSAAPGGIGSSAPTDWTWDGSPRGIGNSAIAQKLDDKRVLIYGGFQYSTTAFLLDLSQNYVQTLTTTGLQYTDLHHQGLNTTPFFADRQGSALSADGSLYFFGFHNGFYEMPVVIAFDSKQLYFKDISAEGFKPRAFTDAYSLKDGKVLIAGGWEYAQGGAIDGGPNAPSRRVEIFDPANGSFTRVADYPIGKFDGQHAFPGNYVTQTSVCVPVNVNALGDKYSYDIEKNQWTTGCTPAERPAPQYSSDGSSLIGSLSNGNKVYINFYKAEFSATVDSTCSCYRLLTKTKVSVVK